MKYFALILLLIISCNDSRFIDNKIYKPNFDYDFKVEYFVREELQSMDKLILSVGEGYDRSLNQTASEWKLITKDEDGEDESTEQTSFIIETIDSYFLQMPKFEYFYFLHYFDEPQTTLKEIEENRVGKFRESQLQFTKLYKGITVTQVNYKQTYMGKLPLGETIAGLTEAYKFEASSLSKLGEMTTTFWFDENLGFIKLEYNLPEYKKIIITYEKSIEVKDEDDSDESEPEESTEEEVEADA